MTFAVPPQAIEQTIRIKTFTIGSQDFTVAEFDVKFDQVLYINGTVHPERLVEIHELNGIKSFVEDDGRSDTVPNSVTLSSGVVKFVCEGTPPPVHQPEQGIQTQSTDIVSTKRLQPKKKSNFRVKQFNIRGLTHAYNTIQILGEEQYQEGGSGFPVLWNYSANGVQSWSEGFNEDGPPSFLMVAPPVPDATSSFLGSVGGFPFANSTVDPTHFTAAFIIKGCERGACMVRFTPEELRTCQPALIFPGDIDESNQANFRKKITWEVGNPAPGNRLVNKDNEPVSSIVRFTTVEGKSNSTCSVEFMENVKSRIAIFDTILDGAESREVLEQVQFMMASITSMEGWIGCRELANKMFKSKMKQLSISEEGSTQCHLDYRHSDFATDPCCNRTLTYYDECCSAEERGSGSRIINVKVLDSIVENEINTRCAHPSAISQLLTDFINQLAKTEADNTDSNVNIDSTRALFEENYEWTKKCDDEIWNKQCESNRDCIYSGICNEWDKRCYVMESETHKAFALCMLEKAPAEIKGYIKKYLKIPQSYASEEDEKSAVLAAYTEQMTSEDCFGRESEQHRKQCTWERSSEGYYEERCMEGNQTSCLEVKACNWASWNSEFNNQQKCVDDYAGFAPKMCHVCWDQTQQCNDNVENVTTTGDVNNIAQYPRCVVAGSYDQIHCDSLRQFAMLNTTWRKGNQWDWQAQCMLDEINEEVQDCLPIEMCGNNGDEWSCNRAMCYNFNVSRDECLAPPTQDEVNQGKYRYTWWEGHENGQVLSASQYTGKVGCRAWIPQLDTLNHPNGIESSEENMCDEIGGGGGGYKLWRGRWYQKGQMHTKEKCSEGLCDIWNRETGVPYTAEECVKQSRCTKPCAKCNTWNYDFKEGRCFADKNIIMNSSACESIPGAMWQEYGQWDQKLQQDIRSFYCMYEIAYNQSYCENNRQYGVWKRCGDLPKNDEGCQGDPYAPALSCWYESWAECDTREECEATGECPDWDLQTCFSNPNTFQWSCVEGACIKPFILDDWGNPNCYIVSELANKDSSTDNTDGMKGTGDPSQFQEVLQWSQLGCKVASGPLATNKTSCELGGGSWKVPAKSKSECDAHGSRCFREPTGNHWMGSEKNAQKCSECNGEYRPVYQWMGGIYENGTIKKTQWIPRKIQPVNTWGKSMDHRKRWQMIDHTTEKAIALVMKNDINKKFKSLLGILERIAADCTGSNVDSSNLLGTPNIIDIGTCDIVDTGVDMNTECNSLFVNHDTFGGQGAIITVQSILSGSVGYKPVANSQSFKFITNNNNNLRLLNYIIAYPGNSQETSDIVNSELSIIGQRIGDGSVRTFDPEPSIPVRICLDINNQITQATTAFPMYDFAKGVVSNQNRPGEPMLLSNVSVEGNQLCSEINSSGTYYPIRRLTAGYESGNTRCSSYATNYCDHGLCNAYDHYPLCSCFQSPNLGYWEQVDTSESICSTCLTTDSLTYYGGECTSVCSESSCNTRASCNSAGSCVCDSPFTGTGCNDCISGYYTNDCSVTCTPATTCSAHGSCHTTTGLCTCHSDGTNGYWNTSDCSVCDDSHSGNDCLSAVEAPQEESNNESCDCGDYGICDSNDLCVCDLGYCGDLCSVCCTGYEGDICELCSDGYSSTTVGGACLKKKIDTISSLTIVFITVGGTMLIFIGTYMYTNWPSSDPSRVKYDSLKKN